VFDEFYKRDFSPIDFVCYLFFKLIKQKQSYTDVEIAFKMCWGVKKI
jgi:hypothetical protein